MILSAPIFLIGLVALAIPIAVHLFNFRRYKKVYFSNVDHLEQLQSETRRQSTLRQLLILAARILAIVFFVLAFARPVIPNGLQELRTGSNDVSLYIDNSFSMENSDGNGLLLEKAKTKAREIVSAYNASDRFQLMTNDMEGRQFHWISKEEVLQEIDAVELSSSTVTVSTIVRRQSDFLHGGKSNNRYAYLISDFQTSVTDLPEIQYDSTLTVTLVPLEATEINNIFIDSVALNAPVFHRGNSVVAQVWLYNEGEEDIEKVPVTLFVNNKQRAIASVDIPARGSTQCDMHFVVDEGGVLNCRVETSDYPVMFDDKYFFTINVSDRINALVIEGGSTNVFLQRLFEGDSVVHYSAISAKQMDFSRLEDVNMVLLDELPSLTTGMAQTLHTFVEQGGTLVVVPAVDVDESSYNDALSLFGAPRLAGHSGGRRVAASTVNLENMLYHNVFSEKNNDMELPTASDWHRLQSDATTSHEVIITLAGGDEYMGVTQCGNGKVYLFAAPLRETSTDFVRQALFVPTLYNMALYSVRPTPIAATLQQSDPVAIGSNFDCGQGNVTIRSAMPDLDFEEIADLRRKGGACFLLPQGTMNEAGNYILHQEGVPDMGVSLNYSRLESQMTFLGRDALMQIIKDNNLKNCSVVRNVDKPLDSYLKEQMDGRSLWRWCLALCLLMLLAEVLLIKLWK